MITVLGASDRTGKSTAEHLLIKGEKIRVVGRSMGHLKSLAEQGAELRIGDQQNVEFLTDSFKDADGAYVIVPAKPNAEDILKYYSSIGETIISAVNKSGIKKVVFLSSLGAERSLGTGPILGLHDVEHQFKSAKNTDVVFLRAGGFYENLLSNVGLIHEKGITGNSIDADTPMLMVASKDIGARAAGLLYERQFKGHVVEELFGERTTLQEMTRTIGTKIGIPTLPYIQFTDEDAAKGMMAMGLSESVAWSYVEMGHGYRSGKITTTRHDPKKPNAPTKFAAWVDEVFVPAYEQLSEQFTSSRS